MKKFDFQRKKSLSIWFIRRKIVLLTLGIFFLPLGFKYPNPFMFVSIGFIAIGILGIYRYVVDKEIIKNMKKFFELARSKTNQ